MAAILSRPERVNIYIKIRYRIRSYDMLQWTPALLDKTVDLAGHRSFIRIFCFVRPNMSYY